MLSLPLLAGRLVARLEASGSRRARPKVWFAAIDGNLRLTNAAICIESACRTVRHDSELSHSLVASSCESSRAVRRSTLFPPVRAGSVQQIRLYRPARQVRPMASAALQTSWLVGLNAPIICRNYRRRALEWLSAGCPKPAASSQDWGSDSISIHRRLGLLKKASLFGSLRGDFGLGSLP